MGAKAFKMIVTIGYLFLVIGLLLDAISLVWGVSSAITGAYKSGVLFIPLVFYGAFLVMAAPALNIDWKLLMIGFLTMHLLCNQVIPAICDKVFGKKRGVSKCEVRRENRSDPELEPEKGEEKGK